MTRMQTLLFLAALALPLGNGPSLIEQADSFHATYTATSSKERKELFEKALDLLELLEEDGSNDAVERLARFVEFPELAESAISHLADTENSQVDSYLHRWLLAPEENDGQLQMPWATCRRATILRTCAKSGCRFSRDTLEKVVMTDDHERLLEALLDYCQEQLCYPYVEMLLELLDRASAEPPDEADELEIQVHLFTDAIDLGLKQLTQDAVKKSSKDKKDRTSLSPQDSVSGVVKKILALLERTARNQQKHPAARAVALRVLAARLHESVGRLATKTLSERNIGPFLAVEAAKAAAIVRENAAAENVTSFLRKWVKTHKKSGALEGEITSMLETLVPIGARQARKTVRSLAKSKALYLRAAAVSALPLLDLDQAKPRIKSALGHKHWRIRWAAIEACRLLRNRVAVDLLLERMPKEKGRLQYDLLLALQDLTGTTIPYEPADWRKWWDYSRKTYQSPEEQTNTDTATIVVAPDNPKATYFGLRVISRRVCFVLDVSGSMGDDLNFEGNEAHPRIGILKRQLVNLVEHLNKRTFFNVYFFETHYVKLFKNLVPASKKNHRKMLRFVEQREAMGGTNLFDPLEEALRDPHVDTIYVLSDGQPTAGRLISQKAIVNTVEKINRRRRIQINTIAIGEESELLRQIATISGGAYRHVE